jgi:hypothetical protein
LVQGKACKNKVRGRDDLDSFVVSRQPSHGRAGVNNSIAEHGFGYAAGQENGHDSFQITGQYHVTYQKEPITATFNVEVEIVDHL